MDGEHGKLRKSTHGFKALLNLYFFWPTRTSETGGVNTCLDSPRRGVLYASSRSTTGSTGFASSPFRPKLGTYVLAMGTQASPDMEWKPLEPAFGSSNSTSLSSISNTSFMNGAGHKHQPNELVSWIFWAKTYKLIRSWWCTRAAAIMVSESLSCVFTGLNLFLGVMDHNIKILITWKIPVIWLCYVKQRVYYPHLIVSDFLSMSQLANGHLVTRLTPGVWLLHGSQKWTMLTSKIWEACGFCGSLYNPRRIYSADHVQCFLIS